MFQYRDHQVTKGSAVTGTAIEGSFNAGNAPRLGWLAALCVLCLVIAVLHPQMVSAVQEESELLCVEGQRLAITLGQHTKDCVIDTITDADTFTLSGSSGSIFQFAVSETNNPYMELLLEVYAPSGTKVINKSTGGNIFEELVLPESGCYTISIRESGADETGGYMLEVEKRLPPLSPEKTAFGVNVNDAVSQITDTDFFTIDGQAGSLVSFGLSETDNPYIELHLTVYDSAGNSLIDKVTGGNIVEEFTLPETGSYLLSVKESGLNETGGYALLTQCVLPPAGQESCEPQSPEVKCDGIVATIVGTETADNIVGTEGDDVIVGLGGNDRISGLGGNDLICGDAGNDTLLGGEGNDRLIGGEGHNVLLGERGNDTLLVGTGKEKGRNMLYGMAGNDSLTGASSDDVLVGGEGDDFLNAGAGRNDICDQTGDSANPLKCEIKYPKL